MDRVRDYHGSERLPFVSINTTWLKGFESWYNINGSQNSAAIHLRNIRTLFNIALDDYGLSPEYYPFRKFKIKTQQTIHRDMSPSEIAYLMAFKPEKSFQETARDLWLLSFFLVGINFKDLLHLPKGAIKKGRIVYNRAKTGTIFSINVEPEALEIINKYKGDKYLLNILEQKQGVQITKTRKTPIYKDVTDRTNRKLKEITQAINSRVNADYLKKNGAPPAEELEVIDPGLSTYFGRHSVGSIASKLGIAHDVIREALGHSRTVTDIYINFYTPRIDAMMRQIIDEVKKELSGLTGDQPA